MANIYERIRAQQAKRDAKAAAPSTEFKRQMKLERKLEQADARREARIEALVSGEATPRNAEEQRLADRALFGFDDDLYLTEP